MDNASGMDVFKCSEYLVDQELNVIIAKSLDFKNIGKICAHQDGNKISGKRQKMAMDMIKMLDLHIAQRLWIPVWGEYIIQVDYILMIH
jgi:hypothetical protein